MHRTPDSVIAKSVAESKGIDNLSVALWQSKLDWWIAEIQRQLRNKSMPLNICFLWNFVWIATPFCGTVRNDKAWECAG